MNNNSIETKNVLEYWSAVEQLSPYKLDSYIKKIYNSDDFPKTISGQKDKLKENEYISIYVGCAKVANVLKLVFNTSDNLIEKNTDETPIYSFRLDRNFLYKENSFMISPFFGACLYLIRENYNAIEWYESYVFVNNRIKALFDETYDNINGCLFDFLQSIPNNILERYNERYNERYGNSDVNETNETQGNLIGSLIGSFFDNKILPICYKSELVAKETDGMLTSFYMDDMIKFYNQEEISDKLNCYINMKEIETEFKIDTDIDAMKNQLAANKFPMGMFPSDHSPSLMQQIAINIAINDTDENCSNNIFSVNGPPGTGKTTLLKEIVASNVVQRAKILSGLNPSNAFTTSMCDISTGNYKHTLYAFPDELVKYGMIVASTNNAAVENISVELPKALGDKPRTGFFKSDDNNANHDNFFADVANVIIGADSSLGLLSAKLGNKGNVNKFRNQFWFGEKIEGTEAKKENIRKYSYRYHHDDNGNILDESDIPLWETAVDAFNESWEAVLIHIKYISDAQERLQLLNELKKERDQLKEDLLIAEKLYTELQDCYVKLLKGYYCKSVERDTQINNYFISIQKKTRFERFINGLLSLIKNIFFCQYNHSENIVDKLNAELHSLSSEVKRTGQMKNNIDFNMLRKDIDRNESDIKKVKLEIINDKVKFGDNYPDSEFWEKISNNDKSQTACPWTYKDYDKAREDLFYKSLILHKSFLMNNKGVWSNINLLMDIWNNKIVSERDISYSHALNTLLLFVPVLSTTFASVQSFLRGIGESGLGTLIIDEAGQASPYAALGALWRTQKAIVVGDPLQIEPIVSPPNSLLGMIATKLGVKRYTSSSISVQTIADLLNPYKGMIKETKVGCPLVVHRRCINPMFSISNIVAYDNKMIYATNKEFGEKNFIFTNSCWYNIKGNEIGEGDHTVKEQVDFVIKMLSSRLNVSLESLPNVFIISPFKLVASAIRKALREKFKEFCRNHSVNGGKECKCSNCNKYEEFCEWTKEHCGTVHTFQGKEADEVIFVLGCGSESPFAISWVVQQPNLINVAVSRAKYRLVVVGDYELWSTKGHMETVANLQNALIQTTY